MLNTFPELLNFSFFAPTILRITAGLILIYFGWLKLSKNKESEIKFFEIIKLKPTVFWLWFIALVEIIIGILITIGFLTQISAIIASIIMLASIIIKLWKPFYLPNTVDFYILFFIVFISLIFTGAGGLAFDLPL